jgi:DDE superfamily endonuclease
MEGVLDIYTRPYDARHPQVCLDETSKQLVSETRVPIPAEPGQVERFDYEYERQGVCSLFMCFEPLTGKRHVTVSAHRTKQDFAQVLRNLVDVQYPNAEKIVLVLDNLNTHDFSALYETFEPEEAWRIREKIEIHYTPKHGSWPEYWRKSNWPS